MRPDTSQKIIETAALMRPIAHFSHALRIDDTIYVGATAGTDADRHLIGCSAEGTDVAAQAHRMFDNLDIVLGLLGAGLKDLVKLKTYVADLRYLRTYHDVYRKRFGSAGPAHAVAGSWHFPLPGAAIELDAIAIVDGAVTRHDGATGRPPVGASSGGLTRSDHHYATVCPGDSSGDAPASDLRGQCRQVVRRLVETLEGAGFRREDLCHLQVTLADPRFEHAFDDAFIELFKPPFPARSVVSAALETSSHLLQLESFAVKGGGRPVGVASSSEGPRSPAIVVGDTLYTSGFSVSEAIHGQPPVAQTDATWRRIVQVVADAGFPSDSVVRTNNVLIHWDLYAAFNESYGRHVSWPYPPRTTILGSLRNPIAGVQIEAIAHRRAADALVVQVPGTIDV